MSEDENCLLILADVIKRLQWNGISINFFVRFLNLFRVCLSQDNYKHLLNATKMCIYYMIENLSNTNLQLVVCTNSNSFHSNCSIAVFKLDTVLKWILVNNLDEPILKEFATIAEHAAILHVTKNIEDAMPKKICKHLYELMCSKYEAYSLLGNRIFQNLICKSEQNKTFFTTLYVNCKINYRKLNHIVFRLISKIGKYNIKISKCNNTDKAFFRKYGHQFHDQLFYSIFNHPNSL